MKAGLFALLLLIVSATLGIALTQHQGRLILILDTWQIEMSLVTLALMLILGVFALWGAAALLALVRSGLKRLATWRERRAYHRHLRRVRLGLQRLTEGNWRTAERLLLPNPQGFHGQGVHGLGPDLPSEHQGAQPATPASLPNALEPADWERLLRLLEAQTMLLTGAPRECLTILARAPLTDPMAALLRGLACEQQGDVVAAAEEISRLQGQPVLAKKDLERRLVPLMQQALLRLAEKRNLGAVRQLWSHLRTPWSKHHVLQAHYALALLACGETQEARTILRRLLKPKAAGLPMEIFLQIAALHHIPVADRTALIDDLAQGDRGRHAMVQLARAQLALEAGQTDHALQLLPQDHMETDAARLKLAHLCLVLNQPERAAQLFDRTYAAWGALPDALLATKAPLAP